MKNFRILPFVGDELLSRVKNPDDVKNEDIEWWDVKKRFRILKRDGFLYLITSNGKYKLDYKSNHKYKGVCNGVPVQCWIEFKIGLLSFPGNIKPKTDLKKKETIREMKRRLSDSLRKNAVKYSYPKHETKVEYKYIQYNIVRDGESDYAVFSKTQALNWLSNLKF